MDDFPDFGTEDVRVEDNNNNNNTEYQQFEMMMDGTNYTNQNNDIGIEHNWNIPTSTITNIPSQDPFGSYQVDEEEENRQRQRKAEEDERRSKLMQKMNDEIRIKQELRDRARQYLENWTT